MLSNGKEGCFMKKINKYASYFYNFILGLAISRTIYSKKYICGKWFQSPYKSLGATGWEWVVKDYRSCKLLGVNQNVPWPCSPRIQVVCPENITFHPDDLNNFQTFGNYFQALGKITIGHGTWIAPNVGLITANHCVDNLEEHEPAKPITLGENCWIGMNSTILPGVTLGPRTIVGAGSVVTKSFPDGNCVIAGNPAKVIRTL